MSVTLSHDDGMMRTRSFMIERLQNNGIYSSALLEAMSIVPRHIFVSEALRFRAYDDRSLPIGEGQTISKPSIIALMVQALNLTGNESVLEIGTGSGYQTAILSLLAGKVTSMERVEMLYRRARNVLMQLNVLNTICVHSSDFNEIPGTFDSIIVAAGASIFPEDLLEKLNDYGTLIIPVSKQGRHVIKRFVKRNGTIIQENIGDATFVPYVVD